METAGEALSITCWAYGEWPCFSGWRDLKVGAKEAALGGAGFARVSDS